MVSARRLVILIAGALTLWVMPAAAEATFPGANGQIAYTEQAGTSYDIVAVNPNGTNRLHITNDAFIEEFPSWSPNGSKIAFAGSPDQPHTYQILVMNADGTNKRQLTHLPGMSTWPSWSPDGSHIVFLYDQNNDGASEIYTIEADGSDLTRVTSTGEAHDTPRWSPDGQRIAFAAQASTDRSSDYDLYTIRPDGSDVRRIAALPGNQRIPDWSPDGAKLVFTTQSLVPSPPAPLPDIRPIYTMNVDGTGLARVGEADGYFPVWSPDGTTIAYQAWTLQTKPGQSLLSVDLATVKPDGTDFRYLDSDPLTTGWAPSWQRLATAERDCLAGGWRNYGNRFKNQGQCVAFVEHGTKP